jgi:hypothetical protein
VSDGTPTDDLRPLCETWRTMDGSSCSQCCIGTACCVVCNDGTEFCRGRIDL